MRRSVLISTLLWLFLWVPAAAAASDSEPPMVQASEPVPPPSAVRATVGFRAFSRSMTWAGAGAASSRLVSYSMPLGSAAAVDAQWFPGAHFGAGPASDFGAFFQGDFGVGLTSRRNVSLFPTSSQRLRFGAIVRLPSGAHFEGLFHAGYQVHEFSIAQFAVDGLARPAIPSVAYTGPRAGAGFRLPRLGPLTLELTAGVMYALDLGELQSNAFFPNASAFGIDASFAASLPVVDNIEVRLGFDYTHYFVGLNPALNATLKASSAMDLYLGGTFSLVWVM